MESSLDETFGLMVESVAGKEHSELGLRRYTENIAKTGSLCCVASRPHGSSAASRDWSMGPHEPYWRTNTSFSPPPSRWDFGFHPEGLPYSLHDDIQLYVTSTSSNEKDSRGWVRGNHLYDLHYSASDSTEVFLSSPSDPFQGPQWTPPAIQEISNDDYQTATRKVDPSTSQITFPPNKEGTSDSENLDCGGSTSSQSENSFSEFDASNPLKDARHWSSASSSLDFVDVSQLLESETYDRPRIPTDLSRCSMCERFLSQRSPWSTRRIVRSGDMPTTGVLPCCHVFHAECLERATQMTQKNDPPCPLCVRLERENSPGQQGFPRLWSFSEDAPSRPWFSAQVGDCVEGAVHAPPRNAMFLLNRNRSTKNLLLKGNIS